MVAVYEFQYQKLPTNLEPFQINITEDNVMRRGYYFVNFDAAEHTMVGQTKQTQAWQATQKTVHPSEPHNGCCAILFTGRNRCYPM